MRHKNGDDATLEPYNKPEHVVRSREECADANQPSSTLTTRARTHIAVRGSQRKLTHAYAANRTLGEKGSAEALSLIHI